MTTEDVVSAHTRPRRAALATKVRMGAVATLAVASLAACSAQNGYIDGWWDNGDPIYVPLKNDLFDEEGAPLCDAQVVGQSQIFESRAKAYGEAGSIMTSFLFEVTNDEPDPDADLGSLPQAEQNAERQRRERLQGSLNVMYNLTHPTFDEAYGVSDAESLAPIKEELADHLAGLGEEAPIYLYVRNADEWLETPDGRYNIGRIGSVEEYIESQGINHTFNGIRYTYLRANGPGGEFLVITDRETGETVLKNADEEFPMPEGSELFAEYEVDLDVNTPNEPEATITIVNDQCPAVDGGQASRWWIYDYELLFPQEEAVIEL